MARRAKQAKVTVSEEQALYFRAQRGGLAGAGADNAVEAARAILGGQAQLEAPALLALSQRAATNPTASELQAQLWEDRRLVRTWGQRDTVHVYAIEDWPEIVAARAQWAPGGRRGEMPTAEDLAAAREVLDDHQGPLGRKDLYLAVTKRLEQAVSPTAALAKQEPLHFAAGRLIWQLSNDGDLCTIYKKGSEQLYAYRKHWLPELPWPDELDPIAAAARLTKRYLAVYGPATVQDIGHHFGARLREVRTWMEVLHAENALHPVQCEDREDLWLCVEDIDALQEPAPTTAQDWPVRLLPGYDSMLMGHADKRWTVPDEAERKLIWKKAAVVRPVVLDKGRIIATWSHKARKKALALQVEPLSGWSTPSHKAAVTLEAERLATHLGLPDAEVTID